MDIAEIRESRSERRSLIEAPGHELTPEEIELGVSLFSLSASFDWTAYLYSPLNRSTLYNWEGELFDFWTDSEGSFAEMDRILKQFELEKTQ